MLWLLSISRFYFSCLKNHGKPRDIIYCLGGLGDDLCLTVICKAYFLKYGYKPNIFSRRPALFEGNPYINSVLDPEDYNRWNLLIALLNKFRRHNLKLVHLSYYHQPIEEYPDRGSHLHLTQMMASQIDISTIELKNLIGHDVSPLLYSISDKGDASIIPNKPYILIHSSSLSAPFPVKIKEWTMFESNNRFIDFCKSFGENINIEYGQLVQIGSPDDIALPNTLDLRGKTDLPTLALLCKNADCFIGLEGGIMHFAKAYKTSSIIIYGGRTMPQETGYVANNIINLYNQEICSPCWGTDICINEHICMTRITPMSLYDKLCELLGSKKAIN